MTIEQGNYGFPRETIDGNSLIALFAIYRTFCNDAMEADRIYSGMENIYELTKK